MLVCPDCFAVHVTVVLRYGDSVHTVPKFYAEHPDVKCDIVVSCIAMFAARAQRCAVRSPYLMKR